MLLIMKSHGFYAYSSRGPGHAQFAGSSCIPCLCLAANFAGTHQRSTSECSITKAERVASISLEQQPQVSYQGLVFATLTALLRLILSALLSVGCTKLTSSNSSCSSFIRPLYSRLLMPMDEWTNKSTLRGLPLIRGMILYRQCLTQRCMRSLSLQSEREEYHMLAIMKLSF